MHHLSIPGRAGLLAAVGRWPGQTGETLAALTGCPEAWVYEHITTLHRAGLLMSRRIKGRTYPQFWMSVAGRKALANHAEHVGKPETEAELQRISGGREAHSGS